MQVENIEQVSSSVTSWIIACVHDWSEFADSHLSSSCILVVQASADISLLASDARVELLN